MTSTARSAMRLASSWMVMVSGMRHFAGDLFLRARLSRWPVMRWTRRRNEATERSRTSSAVSAVTTVRRPRRFSPTLRVGFGAGAGRTPRRHGAGRAALRPRRPRARDARRGLAAVACIGAEALLGDLVGLALGLLVVLAAALLRRACALPRRALGALGFLAGAADAGFFLGELAFFGFAQLGVGERMGAARCAPPR